MVSLDLRLRLHSDPQWLRLEVLRRQVALAVAVRLMWDREDPGGLWTKPEETVAAVLLVVLVEQEQKEILAGMAKITSLGRLRIHWWGELLAAVVLVAVPAVVADLDPAVAAVAAAAVTVPRRLAVGVPRQPMTVDSGRVRMADMEAKVVQAARAVLAA